MKVWISSESSGDKQLGEELWKLYMKLEKAINKHLQEIEYENDKLDSLDVIIILRDDDYFNEIKKYRKSKKDTDIRLKIDYNTFLNANEEERKNLILDVLLRSLDILEEKGLDNFEEIRDYFKSLKNTPLNEIEKQIE